MGYSHFEREDSWMLENRIHSALLVFFGLFLHSYEWPPQAHSPVGLSVSLEALAMRLNVSRISVAPSVKIDIIAEDEGDETAIHSNQKSNVDVYEEVIGRLDLTLLLVVLQYPA